MNILKNLMLKEKRTITEKCKVQKIYFLKNRNQMKEIEMNKLKKLKIMSTLLKINNKKQ